MSEPPAHAPKCQDYDRLGLQVCATTPHSLWSLCINVCGRRTILQQEKQRQVMRLADAGFGSLPRLSDVSAHCPLRVLPMP